MGKPFKLQNGQLLLSTEAPGGVYNSTQLRKIAELCDGDSAVAKATEDQRLALFVPPDHVAKVATALRSTGLGVRHYQDGLHQPVNCVGEFCPEHQQDAMSAGMEIAAELAAVKLESPLKIGINGCARGCIATHTLDISILGDSNGYRISLGGKNSQIPEMAAFMADGVPSAKLPKLIAKIVSIYKEIAEPGESLQEVIERHGASKFIAALSPYSQDAHQGDASGLDGFGEGEPQKLDDLGVPQFPRHDGPAIDANLAGVDLGNEPAVDGLRPEPALEDYEEEVVSDQELEAEAELEPIQPIDETVDESVVADHEEPQPHEVQFSEAEIAASAMEPVSIHHEEPSDHHEAELHTVASEHHELDVVKLEAASRSLDDELDVKLEPTVAIGREEPALRLVPPADMNVPFEEELITEEHLEDELHSEDLHSEEIHSDVIHEDHADVPAEVALEPEHLVADELDVETASLDPAEHEQDDVMHEAPAHEALSETSSHRDIAALSEALIETTPILHEDDYLEEGHGHAVADEHGEAEVVSLTDESAIESSLPDQRDHADHEAPIMADSSHEEDHHVEFDDQAMVTATPDESLVPVDATPLLSQATAPTDLLGSHADVDSEDSVTDDIEAVGDDFVDDEMPEAVGASEIEGAEADRFEANISAEIAEEENIPEAEDHNRDDRHAAMQLLDAEADQPKEVTKEETKMATNPFPPRMSTEPVAQAQRPAGFEFIGLDFNADGRISLQFASGAVMAIDPWALVGASRRELRLAGKVIVLTPVDGGINVEVDGIAIFLPQKAAA